MRARIGANECLVFIFPLAFLVFWRCLFLGVARFGCFGFACYSPLRVVCFTSPVVSFRRNRG